MAESIIDIPADVLAYSSYINESLPFSSNIADHPKYPNKIPNNVWTEISSFSLTEGLWLIHIMVRFDTNASGIRAIVCYNDNSFNFTQPPFSSGVVYKAAPQGYSVVEKTMVANVSEEDAPYVYYIGARQTSGVENGLLLRSINLRRIRLA